MTDCLNHRPEYIGFNYRPPDGWLQIAHPYLRATVSYWKCFACGERTETEIRPDRPDIPYDFDRVRRSTAAEESPRQASRTVINT